MVKRNTDWKLLVFALLATIVVMAGVYYVGLQLNQHKVETLKNDINELEVDQRSQRLGFELTETARNTNRCQAIQEWRTSTLKELDRLTRDVEAYEDSTRLQNSEYENMKRRYTNLVIQNMLELRRVEERCNQTTLEVIYLYSDSCQVCEDQGTILTHYRNQYPDTLAVHPLDTDLDMRHVNFIEELHDVERYPAMIVNGELYEGFKDKEEMGEILENHMEDQEEAS